ncbi:hypothetical protein CL614_07310, partial [archaeon]|nr:hypothetical protein [archaeon]
MGWMKNKRRREREAKQSRKLEAEWWYEPNIEIEHVPEQLGEEEITPPIDNEYLINNALDNDDLNTEWYIRLSWDTCTEQLKQLKIAQRNGGNSLTNAQSQYEIKKTRLQNELKTATNTLTAPGTISKNKILGTTYGLSHGIFLNNLNDNDIQTIKTLGFNLIASELAYHTLESSIPAIAADIAHSEGYQGQGRRLGVIDSNIEVQNIAFGCDEEVSPSQMDPTCDKVTGYNFRHFYKGDATDDIVFPPGEPYSFSFSYCQAYPADAVCDWCRYGSIADQRCDPWDTWWSDIVCECGQGDEWSTINGGVECLTDGTFANDCDIYDSIYAIGKNPGIGTEQEGPGGSYHSHSDHGHHVASTVAGYDSQDGSGTVGVAPGSEIVHFKGEQNSGSYPQWELYLALELAIRETPSLDAINMSLGSKDSPMWCYDLPEPAIQPIVEMVNNAGAIGLQVVASAGNSGPESVTYSTAHNSQPYGDFLYYYGRAGLLDDVLPDLDIYNWNSQTINPAFQNVKKYEDMYNGGCLYGSSYN